MTKSAKQGKPSKVKKLSAGHISDAKGGASEGSIREVTNGSTSYAWNDENPLGSESIQGQTVEGLKVK